MTSVAHNPFEALANALTVTANRMGNKQTLIRYLRNYYFDAKSVGDLLVNEMIAAFEGHEIPNAEMFIIEHSDTELVEICARHIVEDAMTSDKIAAWMACQR